jgi:hypothetical protein
MTIKVSTGLRNKVLDTGSLKASLSLGFIDIYAGTVPVTADDSIGALVKLVRISVASGATGLSLAAAAADGVIAKAAEVWSGTNLATGVASFYRFVAAGDDGALSTTQARIQGSVGLAGADLNLTSTSLTVSAVQVIDYYVISLPTL